MPKQLFVNVAVSDLKKTIDFFTGLGFTFNPKFTDENATCMIVSESNYFMFLVPKFFQEFTKKPIADAKTVTEGLFAISLDSNDEVNRLVDAAIALGAREYLEPRDLGFMYSRSFEDLDGHQWEFFYMDPRFDPDNPTNS